MLLCFWYCQLRIDVICYLTLLGTKIGGIVSCCTLFMSPWSMKTFCYTLQLINIINQVNQPNSSLMLMMIILFSHLTQTRRKCSQLQKNFCWVRKFLCFLLETFAVKNYLCSDWLSIEWLASFSFLFLPPLADQMTPHLASL